ncbi:peptidylprolyl isomerase [Alphaproteobacteria bacterium]|nr:peptidylprolyl isomerase [Alphaproteobacteria bacterium]
MSFIRSFCCAALLVSSPIIFATTSSAQENKPENKITVADVNGEAIYLEEVMRLAEKLPAEYRQRPLESYFGGLVDDVIDSRLAAVAGAESGLSENPDVSRLMEVAAMRVLAEAWIAEQVNEAITEDALTATYKLFISDNGSREEVKARHILVPEEATARAIIEKLTGGADFAEIAKTDSTGPSGPNGGDLGYFARGAMVPTFEAAAFELEPGSFTPEPVQTQFGWHIIKVEDKRVATPPSFEEMVPQLRQNLLNQTLGQILEKLRASAQINRRSFEDIRTEAQAAQAQ